MSGLTAMVLIVMLNFGQAQAGQGEHLSDYAGEQRRDIKALSARDLEELRRGGGWGLARAAELNGYPGPLHLLQMQAELGLSEAQIGRISAIYDDMKAEAISNGAKLIALERTLDEEFRQRTIDSAKLEKLLSEIAEAYRRLRRTHLSAHLKTVPILSAEQTGAYQRLRGYAAHQPCETAPHGRTPQAGHKHDHCG